MNGFYVDCKLKASTVDYASHNLATTYHHLKILQETDNEYNINQCCCNFSVVNKKCLFPISAKFPFQIQSYSVT